MMCNMQISVDELENSISVKISKEAVMSINSPESLFTSVNGKLQTKVYIAGLPNRTDNLIKPVSRSSESTHTHNESSSKNLCFFPPVITSNNLQSSVVLSVRILTHLLDQPST